MSNYLLPELWSLKCQKWLILHTFCWIQQKISPSLDKIFKCIWGRICSFKVFFSPLRKYYGLCTLEVSLKKFQRYKIQDFGIPLFTQKFLYLSTIFHEQLSPKFVNYTIFCNNSIISSMCTWVYCPNCDKLFSVISRKYKILAISDILKTITMGVNMRTRQMTPFYSSTL